MTGRPRVELDLPPWFAVLLGFVLGLGVLGLSVGLGVLLSRLF